MKRDIPLFVAGLLAAVIVHAEEVRLTWEPSQTSTQLGYYNPIRLELSPEKPEGVTKLPEGLKAPLYGTLKLGPQESPTKATVLLDEPEDGPARLWVDRNGNGDLTDDPPVKWHEREAGSTSAAPWSGGAEVEATYGTEKRMLGMSMYRFSKNDPKRAGLRRVLLYYRNYGFAGKVSLGGATYSAILADDGATGDFRGSDAAGPGVNLFLDLNGDGKFDPKAERFNVRQPFNVNGKTYEITGLTASGGTFNIIPSDKAVVERPKAPVFAGRPFAFEQKNIAGGAVHFPGDYQGKLVLLDFWATWCGPCVRELPGLVKVYEEFHPKGFEILGVSLDDESGPERLPAFTQQKGMTWPQVCDTKGFKSPLCEAYSVSGIPASFLVDGKTGLIVALGDQLRGENLHATVERCLARLGDAHPEKLATAVPPVSNPPPPASLDPVIVKAAVLQKAGMLLAADVFAAQKQNPQPAPVALAPVGTAPLSGREIARRATAGYVRAGWYFQCTKCGRWHINVAGGYAVAGDTVVTAHHVMQPPENMVHGVGHPIIVRGESEVLPVTAVLADDAAMDAIVLRAGVTDLHPLPLGGDVQAGDNVWCLSDPRGERGYFSAGIVNRLVARTASGAHQERINVSTDWAPGSSGAAILDSAGNVIGHVATIRALYGKPPVHSPDAQPGDAAPGAPAMAMNLHEAIPAKSVLTIIPK